MSSATQALFWGAVSGAALLIGACVGYFIKLPHKVVAGVMAFGAGVLISALSFELMQTATEQGGLASATMGFVFGVVLYSAANFVLSNFGAKHRKRSQPQPDNKTQSAGIAIALGALIDGVPESAAIGVSMLNDEGVALVTVFAISISNIPEGLSSSAGMRRSGRSVLYVFTLWSAIAIACAISSWLGFVYLGQLGDSAIAFATALAAGAILVMITQTMIPEAFEDMHNVTGPIAAIGFLVAYIASELFS